MIDNHRTARNNYDRLSRWYDFISGSSERPARMQGLHMLDVQLGERVLEIGCGTGEALSVLAARAGSAGGVFGLDLSAGMLEAAKRKLKKKSIAKICLIQGDATHLPLGEMSFDAIFLSFTLELFPAPEIPGLLRECRRVLRRGGRLGVVSLLQTDKPGWMELAYNWAHGRWPAIIDCRPIPLENILSGAGFEIFHITEISMWGLAVGMLVAVNPS